MPIWKYLTVALLCASTAFGYTGQQIDPDQIDFSGDTFIDGDVGINTTNFLPGPLAPRLQVDGAVAAQGFTAYDAVPLSDYERRAILGYTTGSAGAVTLFNPLTNAAFYSDLYGRYGAFVDGSYGGTFQLQHAPDTGFYYISDQFNLGTNDAPGQLYGGLVLSSSVTAYESGSITLLGSNIWVDAGSRLGVGLIPTNGFKFQVDGDSCVIGQLKVTDNGGTGLSPNSAWDDIWLESSGLNSGIQISSGNGGNQTIGFGTPALGNNAAVMQYISSVQRMRFKIANVTKMEVRSTGVDFSDTVSFQSNVTVNGTFILEEPTWDDMTFPANGFQIHRTQGVLDYDFAEIGVTFPNNASTNVDNEAASAPVQFEHAWFEGSEIRPHLHYIQTDANQTNNWYMTYRWYNVGDTVPAWSDRVLGTNIVTYVSGSLHQIAEFPPIDGTGKTLSSMFDVRIERDGDNDTFNGSLLFKQFDIHIQIDKLGSKEEFSN